MIFKKSFYYLQIYLPRNFAVFIGKDNSMKHIINKISFVFVLTAAVMFVVRGNIFAKINPINDDPQCIDGTEGQCPYIGGVNNNNGSTYYPYQADPSNCQCSGNHWQGSCVYEGVGSFYMYSGSCSNNTRKRKYCTFDRQVISCNAISVSPKYTCGSETSFTCTCSPGATQYKYEASGCSYKTYKRTCNAYGDNWGSWVQQ